MVISIGFTFSTKDQAAKPAMPSTVIASPTSSTVLVDSKNIAFGAYNIAGNNFKLRDVGGAFNFGVDWDGARNTIVIDTNKGYGAEVSPTQPSSTQPSGSVLQQGLRTLGTIVANRPGSANLFQSFDAIIIAFDEHWNGEATISASDITDVTVYVDGAARAVSSFTLRENPRMGSPSDTFAGYEIWFGEPFTQMPATYKFSLIVNGIEIKSATELIVMADGTYQNKHF